MKMNESEKKPKFSVIHSILMLFFVLHSSSRSHADSAVPVILDGTKESLLLTKSIRKALQKEGQVPFHIQEAPQIVQVLPELQKLVEELVVHETGVKPKFVVVTDSLIPNAYYLRDSNLGPIVTISLGLLALLESGDQLTFVLSHEIKHGSSQLQERVDDLYSQGSHKSTLLAHMLSRPVENEVDFKGALELVNKAGRNPYAGLEVFDLFYIYYGDELSATHTTWSSRKDSLSALLTASKREFGAQLHEESNPNDPVNVIFPLVRRIIQDPSFGDHRYEKGLELAHSIDSEDFEDAFQKSLDIDFSKDKFEYAFYRIYRYFQHIGLQKWERILEVLGEGFEDDELHIARLKTLNRKLLSTIKRQFNHFLTSHFQHPPATLSELLVDIALLREIHFEPFLSHPREVETQMVILKRERESLERSLKEANVTIHKKKTWERRLERIQRQMNFFSEFLPSLEEIRNIYKREKTTLKDNEHQVQVATLLETRIISLFAIPDPALRERLLLYFIQNFDALFQGSGVLISPESFFTAYLNALRKVLNDASRLRNAQERDEIVKVIFEEWFSHNSRSHLGSHPIDEVLKHSPSIITWITKFQAQLQDPVKRMAELLKLMYRISPKSIYIRVTDGFIRPIHEEGELGKAIFIQSGISLDILNQQFVKLKQNASQDSILPTVKRLLEISAAFLKDLTSHEEHAQLRPKFELFDRELVDWALEQEVASKISESQGQMEPGLARLMIVLDDDFWTKYLDHHALISAFEKRGQAIESQHSSISLSKMDSILKWDNPTELKRQLVLYGWIISFKSPYDYLSIDHVKKIQQLLPVLKKLFESHTLAERDLAFFIANSILSDRADTGWVSKEVRLIHERNLERIKDFYRQAIAREFKVSNGSIVPQLESFIQKYRRRYSWNHVLFFEIILDISQKKRRSKTQHLQDWIDLSLYLAREYWVSEKISREYWQKRKAEGSLNDDVFSLRATIRTVPPFFPRAGLMKLLIRNESSQFKLQQIADALSILLSEAKYEHQYLESDGFIDTLFTDFWQQSRTRPNLRSSLLMPEFVSRLRYSSNQVDLAKWQLDQWFHLTQQYRQYRSGMRAPMNEGKIRPELGMILERVQLQFPKKSPARNEVLEYVARQLMANQAELREIQALKIHRGNWVETNELAFVDLLPKRLAFNAPLDSWEAIRYYVGLDAQYSVRMQNIYGDTIEGKLKPQARKLFMNANIYLRTMALLPLLTQQNGALAEERLIAEMHAVILGEYYFVPVVRAIFEDYLSILPEGERTVLLARMLAGLCDVQGRQTPLKNLFEAMGPFGIKAAQFLRRSGLLEPKLAAQLDYVFDRAPEPDRLDVVNRVYEAFANHRKNLIAVLEILNAGSLSVTVHLLVRQPQTGQIQSVIARILKPNATELIANENRNWLKTEQKIAQRPEAIFKRVARTLSQTREHAMRSLSPNGSQLNYAIERDLGPQAARSYDQEPDPQTGFRVMVLQPDHELMRLVEPQLHSQFMLYPKVDHQPWATLSPALRTALSQQILLTELKAIAAGKVDPDNHPGNWLVNLENKTLVRIDYPEFVELSSAVAQAHQNVFRALLDVRPGQSLLKLLNQKGQHLFEVQSLVSFSWFDVVKNFENFPSFEQPQERLYWLRSKLEIYLLERDHQAQVKLKSETVTILAALLGLPIWKEKAGRITFWKELIHAFEYSAFDWIRKNACAVLLDRVSK